MHPTVKTGIIVVIVTSSFFAGSWWQFERRKTYDEQKAKDLYSWSNQDIDKLKIELRKLDITPEQMATFARDIQLLVRHQSEQIEYDRTLTATYALSIFLLAKRDALDTIKESSLSNIKGFVEVPPFPISDSASREKVIERIRELSNEHPELKEIIN